MALTAREKDILRLSVAGTSDYRIARLLKTYTPTVTRPCGDFHDP
jgi:DNA-binding CsgD family transcriptional regulator